MRAFENNEKLLIRMPNATRPWQHVIEPLMGYLILAEKMYLNPKNLMALGIWVHPQLKI